MANGQQPQNTNSGIGRNGTVWAFEAAAGFFCARVAGAANPVLEIIVGAAVGGVVGVCLAPWQNKSRMDALGDGVFFGLVGGCGNITLDYALGQIWPQAASGASNAAQQAAAQVTTTATPVPTAAPTQTPAETPRQVGTVIRNYLDSTWCSTTNVAKSPDGKTIYSLGGRISDTLSNNVLDANPIPGLESTCGTTVGDRSDLAMFKADISSKGTITLTRIDASSITRIWDGVWGDICNGAHCCYDNTCYGLKYYYSEGCNRASDYYDCVHNYVRQTIQPYHNPPHYHPTPDPTPYHTPHPTHTPVPTHTTPVPTHTTPVPTHTTPVPTHTTPIPTHTTPIPSQTTTIPTTHPTTIPTTCPTTAPTTVPTTPCPASPAGLLKPGPTCAPA